ncbi:MAG: InlB B-repeat-containing protein, partial [Oscillospiraceae bacterium]
MYKKNKSKRLLCLTLAILMLMAVFPSTALALDGTSGKRITIIMNSQGGSGGTLQIDVENGGQMPNIEPPTRWGYTFLGYWSVASGQGTQYYDPQGTPQVLTCNFTQKAALYAHWKIKTLSITYGNMEGAAFDTNAPTSHTYGANTTISNPKKPSYTFLGWRVNGSPIASQGLVLGAAAYNDNITL